MPDASAWTPFFTAQVGATAALAGLVIVAISINLTRILALPNVTGRAGETIVLLVAALLLSSMALMPASLTTLGAVCVVVAALAWSACSVVHANAIMERGGAPRGSLAVRVVLAQTATLAMVAGSAFLMAGLSAGYFWVATGILIAIVNAVFATWVLLVEILR